MIDTWNPWNIQSIYELQFYICPACIFKNHSKQDFINHAYEAHPDAIDYFKNINDDSLSDISCPWNNSKDKIKIENSLNDIDDDVIEPLMNIKTEEEFSEFKNGFDLKEEEDDEFSKVSKNFQINKISKMQIRNKLKYQCERCDNIFFGKKCDLAIHRKTIHGKVKDYKCDVCGKEFTQLSSLTVHIKTIHEGIKNFKCEFCNLSFRTKGILLNHMKNIHEHGKSHKCSDCSKTFGTLGHLKEHVKRIHDGLKDDQCVNCGKLFINSWDLKMHIKTVHEGQKDHKCDKCGKCFSRGKNLKRHKETVHEGIKNHICNFCGKSFTINPHLKRHILTVHEGKKNFKCQICGNEFTQASSLKSHTEGKRCQQASVKNTNN